MLLYYYYYYYLIITILLLLLLLSYYYYYYYYYYHRLEVAESEKPAKQSGTTEGEGGSISTTAEGETLKLRRSGRVGGHGGGVDVQVVIVWLEHFEDHATFPVGLLHSLLTSLHAFISLVVFQLFLWRSSVALLVVFGFCDEICLQPTCRRCPITSRPPSSKRRSRRHWVPTTSAWYSFIPCIVVSSGYTCTRLHLSNWNLSFWFERLLLAIL